MSSSPTYEEFQVVVPQYEGDLYFMVDSYYKGTIPIHTDCITFANAEDYANYNVDLRVTVENNGASNTDVINSKLYHDDYAEPIILRNYQAGNTFTIKVAYSWNKGVATTKTIPMDYTVSIYSKQLLTIKKCTSGTCDNGNQLFMDGRDPSGFSTTEFILDRPQPYTFTDSVYLINKVESFASLLTLSDNDFNVFFELFMANLWVLFKWW